MKRYVMALAFLASALQSASASAACTTDFRATEEVMHMVREMNALPDAKCELLKKHKLKLNISGSAVVRGGVSVGWVSLRLSRGDFLVSDSSVAATGVDERRGDSEAAKLMFLGALNLAVERLDFEKAAREIAARR